MKKKISLRTELVLIMLFSLFVSLILFITIRNLGFDIPKETEKSLTNKIYAECLTKLEQELEQCHNDTDKMKDTLQKYRYQLGYEFYLTDSTGTVFAASMPGIQKVNLSHLKDGFRIYKKSDTDQNVFKITGCDKINNYYLFYNYLFYKKSDTGIIFGSLLCSVFIFFLLIWGRISYISTIRKTVSNITNGDLSSRVTYKYNDELSGLAKDINQMAAALENEESKKNEFMTNISHDIRTPLTTILGYLTMIKNKDYDTEEELEHYISIMERKGNFLSSMLEDFFQYSKLVSHDISMNKTKINMNELLRQFAEDSVEEFSNHGLDLQLQLYNKPLECMGDAELLARAVNNLLSNALKYAKKNSTVLLRSDIVKKEKSSYILFEISNEPKEKIPQDELKKLFERLYKRDIARNEKGSGLGLSIAKNIVELHEGTMEALEIDGRIIFRIYIKQK